MGLQINRVIGADGVCTYLDEDVHLSVFVLMGYGFDLEEFDTFLDSIGQSERKSQLLEWRSHTLHAVKQNNELAAEGWCNALNASRYEYERSKSLLPIVSYGKNAKEARRKGGNAKTQNDADGKQAAKKAAKLEWERWRIAKGKGRWKAGFARKMLDQFPVLDSQSRIEAWAREWEAEWELNHNK